jgi:hypothetical protein
MTKTTKTLVLMTCLALTGASTLSAQTPPAPATRGFVNVNVGAQPQRHDFSTSATFPIYDETATLSSAGRVKNGPFFDISAGGNVWHSLAIGIGYSTFSSHDNASVTASIPNPLFFNQPRTSTQDASSLQRTEHGVHLMAIWFIPVSTKMDVAVSVGPSFIRVKQQLASSATVAAGTQNFTPSVTTESGTVKGVNAGVDGTYMFTPRYGAGILIRYAGGKVDLPSVSDVKAGGFQAGIGIRVRF